MSHIKDDTDTSVARNSGFLRDSVFDWGFNPSSINDNNDGNSRAGSGTEASEDGPSSRYDPKVMSRIVDITDIVDESSSDADSDDDLAAGHSSPTLAGGVERGNGASTGGAIRALPPEAYYGKRANLSGGGHFMAPLTTTNK